MLTSPSYAAPCSLWLRSQASSYTAEIHVALTCCALTALWSTVYHARLSKVHLLALSELVWCPQNEETST